MVKERKMVKEMRYLPAGDKVIVVEFGNEINQDNNHKVRALYQAINSCDIEGIEELIPTYRSLMVQYNPSKVVYKELINRLKELSEDLDQEIKTKQRIIEVPVIYLSLIHISEPTR